MLFCTALRDGSSSSHSGNTGGPNLLAEKHLNHPLELSPAIKLIVASEKKNYCHSYSILENVCVVLCACGFYVREGISQTRVFFQV